VSETGGGHTMSVFLGKLKIGQIGFSRVLYVQAELCDNLIIMGVPYLFGVS
jgi:hypothetical protein